MDWTPFVLSLKLAVVTTVILWLIGTILVYVIHFHGGRFRPFIKALVSLPLVLPPTVLGYYLLVAFHPEGWLGSNVDALFDFRLAFSFQGLVVGSLIFSLPFMVNPILSGLENLPSSYLEAAYTLGKSRKTAFLRVLLPNIKPSILVGIVMAFAHTIGEFGVILMIGGSIPGKTRVASISIYHEVEALHYDTANLYAAVLLGFSLLILFAVYLYQGKKSFVIQG